MIFPASLSRRPQIGAQDATPKLADLGVSKAQSSRWQMLGEMVAAE
jgi:hypothetical protein